MKFLKKISPVNYALDGAATFPSAAWDGDSGNRDSDANNFAAPDARDWKRMVAELRAVQRSNMGYDPDTVLNSHGALSTVTGLTVKEYGNAAIHKTVLTLDDVNVDSTEPGTPAAQAAWGTKTLYTFPQGHIVILGAHQNYPVGGLTARDGGAAGLLDTAILEVGVGSVARAEAADFDLTTVATNQNIVPVHVIAALVAGDSAAIESSQLAGAVFLDGSAAAVTAILNIITATNDAEHGALDDMVLVSGTITMLWTMQGDN